MRRLILGGARSGKSAYAESLLAEADVLYVATSRSHPSDVDFADRIKEHRQRRPSSWVTEDRAELREVLRRLADAREPRRTVIVDDLGTWLVTVMDAANAWNQPRGTVAAHTRELVHLVRRLEGAASDLVLVSPEVGMGVIPQQHSGRLFRDEIGRLNEQLAKVVDEVVLVVAGLPLILKKAQIND